MKTFSQYLSEVLDTKPDQILASKIAKYSQDQMERHLDLLYRIGVPETDPRVKKTKQQIENRKNIQARIAKRA